MTTELETRWSQLIRRIGSPTAPEDASLRRDIAEMYYDLEEALFGARPIVGDSYSVAPDDRRLAILLDAVEALSLLERDDPSYPWDQALILQVTGRSLEAARAYLEAASRVEEGLATGVYARDDEAHWGRAALAHAARCLIAGGQAASAAALLPRLDKEDRAEIEPLVAAAVAA